MRGPGGSNPALSAIESSISDILQRNARNPLCVRPFDAAHWTRESQISPIGPRSMKFLRFELARCHVMRRALPIGFTCARLMIRRPGDGRDGAESKISRG